MTKKHFDVFVIGTGTAGKGVAKSCAENGLQVAIADKRAYGGTCPNRGCDPKKVLVGATEILQMAKNLEKKEVLSTPEINWKALQNFKKEFTSAIPAATEKDLKNLGITLYHQSPKFLDETTLEVEGKTVTADTIVIATGKKPRPLKIQGREHLKHSEDFLELPSLPKSIIFIGGGYIAMEFAQIAARCGTDVTIIEHGTRPLTTFDKDLVKELTSYSKELGIHFIFNANVTKLEKLRTNTRVFYEEEGTEKKIKAEMIFNTTGRVPAIEALELEKGNVAFEAKGVSVNKYLQNTSNKNVYACGDVAASGTFPLTPLSTYEYTIVANNILNSNKKAIKDIVIPSAVFTYPQMATVGISEDQAKAQGFDCEIKYNSVGKWFNTKRLNEKVYSYKIILDKKTKKIIGAHLLAPKASEMINLFTLAIRQEMTAQQLKEILFVYPSWGGDIKAMV